MTDLVAPPPTTLTALTALTAREAADAAAAAVGIDVVTVSDLARLGDIERLWIETWNPGTDLTPITRDLMRAMTHAGSYVGAAYDGERLLGAAFAFFDAPGSRHLHSHLAAVRPEARGRSVGRAIKLHQRAWALEQGVAEVTWTADPLVRRNAHFNVSRLGAMPTENLLDFYGEMSGINAGQGSDRLLLSWPVTATPRPAPGPLDPSVGEPVLWEDADGRPVSGRRRDDDRPALVAVPHDIERLRTVRPDLARAWRGAVRDVLGGLMGNDGRVVGFTRDGSYVVEAPMTDTTTGTTTTDDEQTGATL